MDGANSSCCAVLAVPSVFLVMKEERKHGVGAPARLRRRVALRRGMSQSVSRVLLCCGPWRSGMPAGYPPIGMPPPPLDPGLGQSHLPLSSCSIVAFTANTASHCSTLSHSSFPAADAFSNLPSFQLGQHPPIQSRRRKCSKVTPLPGTCPVTAGHPPT